MIMLSMLEKYLQVNKSHVVLTFLSKLSDYCVIFLGAMWMEEV